MRAAKRTRVRTLQALVGLIIAAVAVATNGPPLVAFVKKERHQWLINTASYKRRNGHWSVLPVPASMRVNAVHAALLYTGKVLIIAGSGNNIGNFNAGKFESLLYDPKTDSFKKISTPTDMFCGGHAFLPDGKLLIAGGTARYEVLHSQIRYAAGVMTVINSGRSDSTILPKGTEFQAADGRLYRSVADTAIPAAKAQPSSTDLWVKAVAPGAREVTRVAGRYTVTGLAGAEARTIRGSANSLTLDQQDFWGTRASYIFDPATERYEKVPNMTMARWYPTLVGLPDGKVLSVSGLDQFGRIVPGNNEVFDPATHRWSAAPNLQRKFPTYPSLFLMPDGNLFFSGSNAGYGPSTRAWRAPGIWNLKRNSFKPVTGVRDPAEMETSASVLLPPAQYQRYAIV
ncbi:MAG: galactose oxidase, partial [Thermoleophilaceae bacterium]